MSSLCFEHLLAFGFHNLLLNVVAGAAPAPHIHLYGAIRQRATKVGEIFTAAPDIADPLLPGDMPGQTNRLLLDLEVDHIPHLPLDPLQAPLHRVDPVLGAALTARGDLDYLVEDLADLGEL